MNLSKRLAAFVKLGEKLDKIEPAEIAELTIPARTANGWFAEPEISRAIIGITKMLQKNQLEKWVSKYNLENSDPKSVGIVMAGNIPFVGFHDLLSVLIAGHHAEAKLSSQDQVLMKYLIEILKEIEPDFKISMPDKLKESDAIIATGSDNSARYFEYYFKGKPNIIRKNRTSVAVLTGKESEEEIKLLAKDIFSYFGLGCRNVSKIYHPSELDLSGILPHFESYQDIANHNKYRNNYDYNKSILLLNRVDHLDNGFLLLQESENMVSPISVLYTESYKDNSECLEKITAKRDKIQCIAGGSETISGFQESVKFGDTQQPNVWDYADGVDTLEFLQQL